MLDSLGVETVDRDVSQLYFDDTFKVGSMTEMAEICTKPTFFCFTKLIFSKIQSNTAKVFKNYNCFLGRNYKNFHFLLFKIFHSKNIIFAQNVQKWYNFDYVLYSMYFPDIHEFPRPCDIMLVQSGVKTSISAILTTQHFLFIILAL